MSKKNILELAARERQAFRTSRLAHDREASWIALEREHILAQGFFWPHIRSHVAMLGYACETRDGPEIRYLTLVASPNTAAATARHTSTSRPR